MKPVFVDVAYIAKTRRFPIRQILKKQFLFLLAMLLFSVLSTVSFLLMQPGEGLFNITFGPSLIMDTGALFLFSLSLYSFVRHLFFTVMPSANTAAANKLRIVEYLQKNNIGYDEFAENCLCILSRPVEGKSIRLMVVLIFHKQELWINSLSLGSLFFRAGNAVMSRQYRQLKENLGLILED